MAQSPFVASLMGANDSQMANIRQWTGPTNVIPTGLFWVEGDATMPSTDRYFVVCLAGAVGLYQLAVSAATGLISKRVLAPSTPSAWSDLYSAGDVAYDHTVSGLTATTVKGAIDELKALIDAI